MHVISHARRSARNASASAAIAVLLSASPVMAGTWSGPVSGNWLDPSRWDLNDAPDTPGETATINAGGEPYIVTLAGDITIDSLTLDAPDATLDITPAGGLTIGEAFNYVSGMVNGTVTLIDATLNIAAGESGSGHYVLRGGETAIGMIDSAGGSILPGMTVTAQATPGQWHALRLGSNFQNHGTLLLEALGLGAEVTAFSGGDNPRVVSNHGTLWIKSTPEGGTANLAWDQFINETGGDVNIAADTVAQGLNVNYGDFSVGQGIFVDYHTFRQLGGTLGIDGHFTTDYGEFQYEAGTVDGTVHLVNSTLRIADAPSGSGNYVLGGYFNNLLPLRDFESGGNILGGMTVTLRGDAQVDPSSALIVGVNSDFENNGTLILDSLSADHRVTLYPAGGTDSTITNKGQMIMNPAPDGTGLRVIYGSLVNEEGGHLAINATTSLFNFVNRGNVIIGEAALFSSSQFDHSSGTLSGNGMVQVPILFNTGNGTISPGTSPGVLTIDGNYEQAGDGRLVIELADLELEPVADSLSITGDASLGGVLEIQHYDGYDPLVAGSSSVTRFVIMAFASRVGEFDSVIGSYVGDGNFWDVIYDATTVTLQLAQASPGDADLNGVVDMGDLSALAAGYGQTSGQDWLQGDFDHDGDVDLVDLTILATHYSAGQAQAMADFQTLAAIPEPASCALIAIWPMLLCSYRQRC